MSGFYHAIKEHSNKSLSYVIMNCYKTPDDYDRGFDFTLCIHYINDDVRCGVRFHCSDKFPCGAQSRRSLHPQYTHHPHHSCRLHSIQAQESARLPCVNFHGVQMPHLMSSMPQSPPKAITAAIFVTFLRIILTSVLKTYAR